MWFKTPAASRRANLCMHSYLPQQILLVNLLSCQRPPTPPAHRFENRAQLIRLAGFDLSASRSGEKSRTAVPVISKKGKADLRYALYQAALVSSSLTSHFRAYYSRLLEGRQREKGIRTKMLVKIAAKMLVIAWTLMKRKEPFNPAHIQA